MAEIKFHGEKVNTYGSLPAVGSKAPDFKLVKEDLSEVSLSDFKGKKVLLNIFPSLDTPVCSTSIRTFNAKSSAVDNTVVLDVSMDLPFAHKRFCAAEGLDRVHGVSGFKSSTFGKDYGVIMEDGKLAGLYSRAVVVLDEDGNVKYTEQVPEITQEPDYEKALNALK
ncbi:MAG: thiol peroxidase [Ignavibacteriales bacterium]|nr:MAG: thiol peroxidase [Ignavibacteriaceae bacterium]MBW7872435.1 thiol peroxidase [Ignavibacteria bacterium]MCZ2143653.1 thiol peroxidase [Ignavibacteriales bacterium]OQY73376.1 MAG: lipid hydroperoxide peroxidase [Ignavibacteriales bacterium UTCHB3]MBV6445417.1 Thiol peroxidase [Ignavibacteriaceae bacterium]